MKVTFLGTGTSTGIPLIGCKCEVCTSEDSRDKRTRTSIFIETKDLKFVIDTGPDFRFQMLREQLDDVDKILFTHPHKDHIAGLDDIRPINFLKNKKIDVFANELTLKRLKVEFPYIFENNYPGVPQIETFLIENRKLPIDLIDIEVVHAMHGNMPVIGFKFPKLVYLTDLNFIEPAEVARIKGIEVLIISALQHKQHYSHFSLKETLELVNKIKPKQCYLIHMSHKLGKHQDVSKDLPPNVQLSYDGLKVEII